jgi:hypothetical protein
VNSQTFFTPETPWDFSKIFFSGLPTHIWGKSTQH